MSTKGKRFLSVPVLAVFTLMCFVYYSSIFVFLHDWLNLQSSPGTLNAYLFSLFAFLSLFSFFSCVLTDPGHVPSSYAPDVEFSKDDHHCLWINNCVGYWNYKAFFVFVLYATMSSIYATVIFISCIFQKDWDPIKGSSLKIFYVSYMLLLFKDVLTYVQLICTRVKYIKNL
ncbi:hypothetical protein V8G54_027785 [Vigna mungo]|uniref:S-acyltransferase n=1 Tax=Vigna mungo TaxID=3915 RepID=A0AAQ3MQ95_VIGMU